ncbi:hypothetical protein IP91_00580 [Pseudoduganella lurida]|uniref:Uncharacterized protein n=1 Tax=Pseudoduganella lurida TaxID=1036180 RepID=A0A562RKH8_9BURK|nr:hypothetical protein [Pseudoduganella lurida]TWI69511.1 hypothetical protein IP91_00580 [Pseudoduganella lurida]
MERHSEHRADGRTAAEVEQGVQLSFDEGVTSALEYMLTHGVPRPIAMRVLSSPECIRRRERLLAAS